MIQTEFLLELDDTGTFACRQMECLLARAPRQHAGEGVGGDTLGGNLRGRDEGEAGIQTAMNATPLQSRRREISKEILEKRIPP